MEQQHRSVATGMTMQKLLGYTQSFGPRYRWWSEQLSYAPADLLAHLRQNQDPTLQRDVEVWEAEVSLGERKVFAWQLYFSVTGAGSAEPSAYYLEDLLDRSRIIIWLDQHSPTEIMAVLAVGARCSTFLTTYYQDQLGVLPTGLVEPRLPLWCSYIESLVYGLDPDERREREVAVSAATLSYWIGVVGGIFDAGREYTIDLDGGEDE